MLKKNKIFLCVLGLIVLATLGGTIAYFAADDNKVNTINMGKLDVEVVEKVEDGIKTGVGATIKAGSSPCWVRVFVGLPKGMKQQKLIETTPSEALDSKWEKVGNYYYYKSSLGGKNVDETVILFDKIKSIANLDTEKVQSELDIVVYAEAIQKEFGSSATIAFQNKKN